MRRIFNKYYSVSCFYKFLNIGDNPKQLCIIPNEWNQSISPRGSDATKQILNKNFIPLTVNSYLLENIWKVKFHQL